MMTTLALTALMIGAVLAWWRRRRPITTAPDVGSGAPLPRIATYRDAPTVRVGDQRRVDRISKRVRLQVKESSDVLTPGFGSAPRFRITLRDVRQVPGRRSGSESVPASLAAHIFIELGGALVAAGKKVEELGPNEFLLRPAAVDDPHHLVTYIHEAGDDVMFMRIRLLEARSSQAELDVLYFSAHWPSV
jgi:hypothetical protein